MASADRIRLALPFDRAALARLEAGDSCLLTGPLYTLRDAGHVRLLAELEAAGGALPLRSGRPDRLLCGSHARSGRAAPFGAVGPTTASRMDLPPPRCTRRRRGDGGQGPPLVRGARCLPRDGFRLFRGMRRGRGLSGEVRGIIGDGGVRRSGNEALRRIDVVDFPVFVGVDVRGRDVYDLV